MFLFVTNIEFVPQPPPSPPPQPQFPSQPQHYGTSSLPDSLPGWFSRGRRNSLAWRAWWWFMKCELLACGV
ncbi:hypothetical protein K440DRAFT_404932 [Wilcoxina mikolae CBS 423.85]|nr:hypothetical protein K440DRAFT_404932 [Wilcoxina mikolae CBS 423.85]